MKLGALLALLAALVLVQSAAAEPSTPEPETVSPTAWGGRWWGAEARPSGQPTAHETESSTSHPEAPSAPSPTRWGRWPTGGWNGSPASTLSEAYDQDSREIAAAAPAFLPSAGQGERRIRVTIRHNLATVEAFEDGLLVRASQAFAGLPGEPTPIGEFRVQDRLGTLRTSIWRARSGHEWDLPYFLQFADDYGFHGPMLDERDGSPTLTFTAGCLALTFEDARWLYEWAAPGTPIQIVQAPA